MNYEVWHIDTDDHVGNIELGNPIEETVGARVTVKVKGTIKHPQLGKFNAIEMRVCRFKNPETKQRYYALETQWPLQLLTELEGFTPKIRLPNLAEAWTFGVPNGGRVH